MTDENGPEPSTPGGLTSDGAAAEMSPGAPADAGQPADARREQAATVADVQQVGVQVAELRDRVERRVLEDQQRQRMYDELYRQLEFARKGLADEYLTPIARELLLVIDRLDALGAVDPEKSGATAAGQELASVRAELAEVLARRGVREVDATGEAFDPRVHEAVGRRVDPDRAGQVVEVRRPGYALGGHLIRPAQVVVGYAGSSQTDRRSR